MIELTEDERFEAMLFWEADFADYLLKHAEYSHQVAITPNFLRHFDFTGIYDQHVLGSKVNYLSLQLGFFFGCYVQS